MAEDDKPSKPPAAKITLPKRPANNPSFAPQHIKSPGKTAPIQRPPKRSPRGR